MRGAGVVFRARQAADLHHVDHPVIELIAGAELVLQHGFAIACSPIRSRGFSEL